MGKMKWNRALISCNAYNTTAIKINDNTARLSWACWNGTQQCLNSWVYYIAPDENQANKFPIYCDMISNWWGWWLIFSMHDNNIISIEWNPVLPLSNLYISVDNIKKLSNHSWKILVRDDVWWYIQTKNTNNQSIINLRNWKILNANYVNNNAFLNDWEWNKLWNTNWNSAFNSTINQADLPTFFWWYWITTSAHIWPGSEPHWWFINAGTNIQILLK